MSAINIVRRPNSLHVITDGAAYDKAGIVLGFSSKLEIIEHLPAAVAMRGPARSQTIIVPELTAAFTSFDGLIDGVEGWLRELTFRHRVLRTQLVMAGWSHARSQPAAFIIGTADMPGDVFTPVAFKLSEMDGAVIALPNIDPAEYAAACTVGGHIPFKTAIDPAVHGSLLIELQRHVKRPPPDSTLAPVHVVDGPVEMATINEAGVSVRTIASYPDRVGELINPAPIDWPAWWDARGGGKIDPAGSNVVSLSPLRRQMMERKLRKAQRRA